jgi:hypothetical protein
MLTDRKVDLGITTTGEAEHFLRFLQVARANGAEMPNVFSNVWDEDCIAVPAHGDFFKRCLQATARPRAWELVHA